MGYMEEYSPNTDWKQYVERLEIFFEVNNVRTQKTSFEYTYLDG
jgi:hypothetical protein